MAGASVKPPDTLEVMTTGNSAHAWERWKRRFQIYLQATGSTDKPGEQKVGLLLHHIGENGIDIFTNFTFEQAADQNDLNAVIAKYDHYFHKRDPQLMLREKYWHYLKREPGQTIDLWVNTVRERANECEFPPAFHKQAVRHKITFACTKNSAKLKLYDAGADISLDNAFQILSLKEATYRELRESKTARIYYVKCKQGYVLKSTTQFVDQRDKHTLKVNKRCGYCNTQHVYGKKNCPAAKNKCQLCQKTGHFQVVCWSARRDLLAGWFPTCFC